MSGPLSLGLRQPDARTCGAASMRMARLLVDGTSTTTSAFASDVVELHRRLTSSHDVQGRRQLPWPRALGTPPWAVERELADITGRRYCTSLALTVGSARAALADRECPAALYVGDRWLPRHVVLVLPGTPLRCYDPASGRVLPADLPAQSWGRWRRTWFAVHSH